MKEFIGDDFLLGNEYAIDLYERYAKHMPIFDFHSHMDAREIAQNERYSNITRIWLKNDHYKWRAMRMNGVAEEFITGDADDKSKFMKWAETMPVCVGNPLYQWTHLELKRYFGINDVLSPKTADKIWTECNEKLKGEGCRARDFLSKSNVRTVYTTDDPADDLKYHQEIVDDSSIDVEVLPTFRADNAIYVERQGFQKWLAEFENISDTKINNYSDLKAALLKRADAFHALGCRISDHSLESLFEFCDYKEDEIDLIFLKALNGADLNKFEIGKYRTSLMVFLGKLYNKLGWTMQLHVGPVRNNNARMYSKVGADTGFDTMTDYPVAENLIFFLNQLDTTDDLPKTIIYNLNPASTASVFALTGCFTGNVPGKVQTGAAWWFNDTKEGIEQNLTALASIGLLGRFNGMVTDSRSILSFARHEYFRRILCDLLGKWAADGEIPNEKESIGKLVQDICYNNAANFFK